MAGNGIRGYSQSFRILVVDNNRIFREGLRLILERQSDFDVIGDADDATALATAIESSPAVVLFGLAADNLENGVGILNQLRQFLSGVLVIVIARSKDDPSLSYHSIRAGAVGYVSFTTEE